MAGQGTASVVVLIASTGEATWGSSGVASRKLHGLGDGAQFVIAQTIEAVPQVGYYGASPIADRQTESGEFTLPGVVTYQEFPKFLNGFFAYTSGSTGSADPYPFYYSAPVSSTQATATYPMEFGTTGNPYNARGCIFNELNITGEAGGNWQFSVGGFAKQILVSSGLSTAAFADARSMTPVRMADTQLYLNPFATGAYAATTGLVSASLISFNLTHNPNRHLKTFAGSINPGGWGDGRAEATLETVLEFNSTQKAMLAELLASSTSATSTGVTLQRQIAIKASATSTAGSSGFVVQLDFAGVAGEPITLWDDRDGNCTISLTWQAKFSTALAAPGSSGTGNYLAFTVYNGSSSTT